MKLNNIKSYSLKNFEDIIEHMKKKRIIYLNNDNDFGDNIRVLNLDYFIKKLEKDINPKRHFIQSKQELQ
jgi:hypothetical protein